MCRYSGRWGQHVHEHSAANFGHQFCRIMWLCHWWWRGSPIREEKALIRWFDIQTYHHGLWNANLQWPWRIEKNMRFPSRENATGSKATFHYSVISLAEGKEGDWFGWLWNRWLRREAHIQTESHEDVNQVKDYFRWVTDEALMTWKTVTDIKTKDTNILRLQYNHRHWAYFKLKTDYI